MKKTHLYVTIVVMVGGALVAIPAFAATQRSSTFIRPTIVGVVTAVSGTALTVSLLPMPMRKNATSTIAVSPVVYTVDTSDATVNRDFGTTTTLALSAIAVNDRVTIFGTKSGTSITATKIIDMPKALVGTKPSTFKRPVANKPQATKTQNRVALGTVTAISGDEFTITSKSHNASSTPVSETVLTTSATTFKENGITASSASLAVGNMVMAVGASTKGTSTASNTLTATIVRIINPAHK